MFYEMCEHPMRMFRDKKMFASFYFSGTKQVLASKLWKKNIALEKAKKRGNVQGFQFCNNAESNERIKAGIHGQDPFFLCRYGATEITTCGVKEIISIGARRLFGTDALHKGKMNSGIFPENEEIMHNFCTIYEHSLGLADMNCFWGGVILEDYVLSKYLQKSCVQVAMRSLEPFQYESPWTAALEGKRVLVVHPFSELIEEQYKKRGSLFENKKILPEFDLVTVKAVQSSGEASPSEWKDWFEALNYLYEQCMETDFDVALLSCGGYAVALGAKLKEAGKKVIVLGGMLQLIFGIKGERWERSRPDIVALYNDSWIRPGDKYALKGSNNMVDGKAYW